MIDILKLLQSLPNRYKSIKFFSDELFKHQTITIRVNNGEDTLVKILEKDEIEDDTLNKTLTNMIDKLIEKDKKDNEQ